MTIRARDDVLDNPGWNSLSTGHTHLALGGPRAKRYPAEMAPAAALDSAEPAAFHELRSLVAKDEAVFLVGIEPPVPHPWSITFQKAAVQMVCHAPIETRAVDVDVLELSESDVPEMLALTKLTRVGPFRSRTYELGKYVGIRVDGQLVSMAGEFLYPEPYREIHVVCTHPDFRGRGYASHLVGRLVNTNLERGLTPFLFVMLENEHAQSIYRGLGFVERRRLPMIAVKLQE